MAIYSKSKRDHDLLGPFVSGERGAIIVQEVIISSRKTRCRAFQIWLVCRTGMTLRRDAIFGLV